MKRFLSLLWMLLIPLASGSAQITPAQVQDGPPFAFGGGGPILIQRHMGPPPDRADSNIRRQLEQIKIWQMTREMNLPTDKAEKFFPLYNQYNKEMRDVAAERRSAIRALDSAVTKQEGNSTIGERITSVLNLDNQLAAIHVKFIRSLGDILSPTEVAKYMVFEQRFDREIRERIRFMMMQRGRRGPDR